MAELLRSDRALGAGHRGGAGGASAPRWRRRWPTRARRCSSPTSTRTRPRLWPNAFAPTAARPTSAALDVSDRDCRRRGRRAGRGARRTERCTSWSTTRVSRRRRCSTSSRTRRFRLTFDIHVMGAFHVHPGGAAVHSDRRHRPHHQRDVGGRAHRHARPGQLLGGQGRPSSASPNRLPASWPRRTSW